MGPVLILDPNSELDASTQIYEQLRSSIILGAHTLRPDQALPTVVDVAEALQVSPKTVERAYLRLKNEGLTQSATARGTTVLPVPREALLAEMRKLSDQFIALLSRMSASETEILALVKDSLARYYRQRGTERRRTHIRMMTPGEERRGESGERRKKKS